MRLKPMVSSVSYREEFLRPKLKLHTEAGGLCRPGVSEVCLSLHDGGQIHRRYLRLPAVAKRDSLSSFVFFFSSPLRLALSLSADVFGTDAAAPCGLRSLPNVS